MILSSGVVSLGNTNTSSTSGPLGAGPIKFTGGTLQYSLLNAADYSARIASSTSPISIDLNGANVTFATALPVSNTGGLALTNSTGSGKLTLTAGNLYTGNTCINAGTLALSGSGSIVSSSNIIVSSGATYDVSGVTGGSTLGSGQMLSGVGTVTGAVTSASIGSLISPATNGVVGTLTFNNDLNLNSGAIVYFDISTSHSSGNDQIVVGGNLTLSGFDVVHVHDLSGAANLDQTADYVLFTVAGTITLNGSPSLVFDGTAPGNAINYSIRQSGNNVVLHFSSSIPPVVNSVVVTNTLDGSTIATHGQTVTVYATVTAGGATITNVSANLGAIGGSPSQVMNNLGGNNYSYTTTVGPSALVGGDLVTVTATDTTPLSGSGSATLTVNASTVTWDGLATDNNWGSAKNWVGNNPPGYSGDNLIFNGSIRTTPNMDRNYAVAGLTFHAGPGSFTITNSPGTALTLNGTIENDCGLPQTLGVPVVLGALGTINDAGFGGITMGGSVSGLYGLIASNGVVTLSGSNSYAGDTTVSGTLMVGSSAAIPNGIGKGNVILDGTLDLNGTNAAVNGLNSAGTVDNTSAISASTLTIGNNNQSSSFSGVVQNSGGTNLALVKVGTGTLSLSGVNTYAGGTTLNGGLLLGNNTAFGTGTITLAGGTLENNGTVTLSNPINVQTNTTTIIDNGSAANFELDGNITGGGTITRGASQVQSLYLGGDNSGFTGTYQDQNNANSITRWTTPTSGSASARWIFNQAANLTRTGLQFTNVGATIYFGSIAGGGFLCENGAIFNSIIEVGALGLNDTFSGSFQSQGSYLAITKVGTGTWTLSGQSVYTGTNTLAGGVVSLGVTNNGATSGPLGSAAPIKFAGGTLQFSAANQNDYSSLIVNSTGPISIDVNGQNVTFATALGASNTGGLVLTNSTGTGTLTSSGANHYSGNTVINGGTLAISTLHASGGAFTVKDGAGLSVANAGGSSTVAMSSLAVGNGGATTLGFANVASTTTPLITSAGALTRNGTSAIVITGAGGLVANQTYPLITASGGIGGTGHFTLSLPVGVAGSLVTNGNTIALVIVPSVNTNPPPIIYSFDGTHLLLSWPTNSGWTLQMQTNSLSTGLGTNWVDLVPGSTGIISTNITVDQSNPAVFYRLKL
jgi:autotransporter-associated beta strand protein